MYTHRAARVPGSGIDQASPAAAAPRDETAAARLRWKPVWHVLEGSFELVLANAGAIRNVPGRKTHGGAKMALAAALYDRVVETGRGGVYVDCARVVSVNAQLSVEPDILAVLWESLDTGRVREVPAASRKEGRFIELEGAPDLVVEVVSDSSERKDRRRLPPLYALAGVPELWQVDVRGPEVELGIHYLGPGGYEQAPADAAGWSVSRFLGCRCRLLRRAVHGSRFVYKLELAPE